ncbi:putative quinol monooxygenase [Burkholderia savannae]|uniref:putative quinol monooxygenase n=1 Tax=Burkholderia savannae TaxID=1637837 RepID=UPI0018D25EC9|nr:hypothetical protein [Burkholderia savannae]
MARGVLASLIPTPQRIGAAAGLRRTAAATRAEPGNRRCDLFRQADGVPGLHMLGIDGDEAAPEARRASAHSVAYRKRAAEWLAQPPAVTALTAVAAVSRRPGATTPCEPCCGGQAALVAIALRGLAAPVTGRHRSRAATHARRRRGAWKAAVFPRLPALARRCAGCRPARCADPVEPTCGRAPHRFRALSCRSVALARAETAAISQ